jgi:Holliday junction resolvase RusA-like endonuclease
VKITIPGRLAGANEYILKCRTNRVAASSFKAKQEAIVKAAVYDCLHHKPRPYQHPVILHYHWFERDRKRDKDNIAFAHKFVQDAFVSIGLIKGDGWNCVDGFTDTFSVDGKRPRIEIEIEEVGADDAE